MFQYYAPVYKFIAYLNDKICTQLIMAPEGKVLKMTIYCKDVWRNITDCTLHKGSNWRAKNKQYLTVQSFILNFSEMFY